MRNLEERGGELNPVQSIGMSSDRERCIGEAGATNSAGAGAGIRKHNGSGRSQRAEGKREKTETTSRDRHKDFLRFSQWTRLTCSSEARINVSRMATRKRGYAAKTLKQIGQAAIREFVSRLLDNAARILETAELGASVAVTILMRGGRPVEVSTANDWSLDALLRERGADEAYRVRRRNGALVVEGRSRSHSCELSRNVPFAGRLLNGACI